MASWERNGITSDSMLRPFPSLPRKGRDGGEYTDFSSYDALAASPSHTPLRPISFTPNAPLHNEHSDRT